MTETTVLKNRQPSSVSLAAELRARRRDRGMKQQELAAQAGISRSYLCDIERGRVTAPSLTVIDSLAAALDMSRMDLLRAAGVVDVADGDIADQRLQKLIAVFRDLSPDGQRSLERFARFLHADEHRWIQQPFTTASRASERRSASTPLFDNEEG